MRSDDAHVPLWRAALLLAAGVLGVVVGVAVGGRHLSTVGFSVGGAVGLGVGLAGVVGIVLGARDLRGRRLAVKVATGLGGLLLLGFLLLTLGQALVASFVPQVEVTRRPEDVGLDAGSVRFVTEDGASLAGWYVPGTNGATVVVAHGAGSTRSAALDQAVVLADAGFGVLLVDARGHGESGGRGMDFGWWGEADLRAAVDHLVAQPEVDPDRIAVLGLSMGGEEALGALGADDRIAAVVAEGVTGRVSGDRAWLSDEYGWRGALQERIEAVTSWLTEVFTPAPRPGVLRDAVAGADRPVLLVAAGKEDQEQAAAEFIAAGAPDQVEVWVVPGAGHTDGLDTAPAEWEARVVAFLDRTLAPS